jgi:hypothetical protein
MNFSGFQEFSAESYTPFSESLFCCFSEQHPSANEIFRACPNPIKIYLWIPKVCIIMSLSFCVNLRIFGALVYMLWIFVHTYQILSFCLFWCRVDFVWSGECDKTFHTLREHLTSAPVLTQPDMSKPIEVFCDASGTVWRPCFLITVINASDRISRVKPVKHWSNLGQPGSSPRKTSPMNPNEPLDQVYTHL